MGDIANISYHDFVVVEISQFFVMLVLLFLSEQYSQTNFPIIKTNPFKVTKCDPGAQKQS